MTTGSVSRNYSGYGNQYTSPIDQWKQSANPDEVKKAGRRSSPAECETCKNRKYQDGSDENVSFKTASHISPNVTNIMTKNERNTKSNNNPMRFTNESHGLIVTFGNMLF